MCLKATANGEKVTFGIFCSDSASNWELISDSKMHLSVKLTANTSSILCLDVDSDGSTIVTSTCRCLGKDQTCDPENQWFRIIDSSRPSVSKNPVMDWFFENLWWNAL